MSHFISKVGKLSTQIITHKDLLRMEQYKKSLIDLMVYEPPRQANGKASKVITDFLFTEVKQVDAWLRKNWATYLHDKNRKLNSAA